MDSTRITTQPTLREYAFLKLLALTNESISSNSLGNFCPQTVPTTSLFAFLYLFCLWNRIGRVNMAIIGCAQWLAIGLYCWTLVAPRLFPDRDFS